MTGDPLEIAWAAGLFEGEGCASTTRGSTTTRVYLSLTLAMVDEDVVRHFHEVVGVGRVQGPYVYGGRKPIWRWIAVGRNALALVDRPEFTHLLGHRRRKKIAEIIDIIEALPPPSKGGRPKKLAVA